jgi:hypothetical protein
MPSKQSEATQILAEHSNMDSDPVSLRTTSANPPPLAHSELEVRHLRQEIVRINEERTQLARMRELDEEEARIRARLHELGG